LGRTAGGEEVVTFVPNPLPPHEPPLEIDSKRAALLVRAEQTLARLKVAGEMAPSLDWFIYAFVRKEAVVSPQIEFTIPWVSPRVGVGAEVSVVMTRLPPAMAAEPRALVNAAGCCRR
jgi:hypothetical protein